VLVKAGWLEGRLLSNATDSMAKLEISLQSERLTWESLKFQKLDAKKWEKTLSLTSFAKPKRMQ